MGSDQLSQLAKIVQGQKLRIECSHFDVTKDCSWPLCYNSSFFRGSFIHSEDSMVSKTCRAGWAPSKCYLNFNDCDFLYSKRSS